MNRPLLTGFGQGVAAYAVTLVLSRHLLGQGVEGPRLRMVLSMAPMVPLWCVVIGRLRSE